MDVHGLLFIESIIKVYDHRFITDVLIWRNMKSTLNVVICVPINIVEILKIKLKYNIHLVGNTD